MNKWVTRNIYWGNGYSFLVIVYICSVDLYLNDYVIDSDKCMRVNTQLKFTCSKLTTETLEKGVKYAQS